MEERDVDVVLDQARRLWAQLFGNHRKRGVEAGKFARRDKNCKRGARARGLPTELQWLKRRRATVRAGVAAAVAGPSVADPEAAWGETHEKELGLQSARQFNKKLRALESGVLLAEEIDDELVDQLLEFQAKRADGVLKRQRQHQLRNMRPSAHVTRVTAGDLVFVDPGVGATPALVSRMQDLGLNHTLERRSAGVIVVNDVGALGQRNSWCLALGGGVAATQEYIMSGFTTGNAVLFMGALDIARNIHVTCDFRAAHPVLSGIVDFKVPGSKWRELDRAALLLKVAGGGRLVPEQKRRVADGQRAAKS